MRTLLSSAVGVVMLAGTASAVDGVLEINQACAVNTGCFAGDAAGFPVEISQAGSYRLTGNLNVSSANVTAIEITARDITLDMNGFAIIGPASGSGTGNGIHGDISPSTANVTVTNGVVRGMGNDGINLRGAGARVEGVQAISNANDGIAVGITGTVTACSATLNGDIGIRASNNSVVTGNTARFNGSESAFGSGISAGNGSTVLGNSSSSNQGEGIVAGPGCTVTNNAVVENTEDGIRCSNGACSVVGNTAFGNDLYGLNLAADTGYTNNVISTTNATQGTVSGGVEIGTNLCDGSTTCP
jgi:hypothetical protein